MKLGKRRLLLVSFMMFSLFFGAGNLIFPPFLGQNAGNMAPVAILGFLMTTVILPIVGVIVIAEFGGLDKLASKVNPKFAMIFTIIIYLSIGPGLGIPRAASVPFELAIAPYLPDQNLFTISMFLYSLIFFIVACWLSLSPNKLIERIGKFLTPTLLTLLAILFINFVLRGKHVVALAQPDYAQGALMRGFMEGYQTLDMVAALSIGLVISTTLRALNLRDKKDVMHYTTRSGLIAGSILATVYLMLSYMGMQSSGVYSIQENGAWTLRCIVTQLFGEFGAIFLAVIFTLACLTACVGLITSVSQYFSSLSEKVTYRQWAFLIVGFSFIICNQGLSTILSISVPILNAIYPVSILLIILGAMDEKIKNYRYVYPVTVFSVGFVSIVYVLESLHIPISFLATPLHALPFYEVGMGWILVSIIAFIVGIVWSKSHLKAK